MELKKEIIIDSVSQYIDEINKNHWDKFVYRGISNISHKLIPSMARYPHINNSGKFDWNNYQLDIKNSFLNEYAMFSTNKFDNDYELWAVAQHHGLITNLLDWTQNPLVALFFAVHKIKHFEDDDGIESVVWALSDFAPFYPREKPKLPATKMQVVLFPRFLSDRFKSQRGCFTFHKLPDKNSNFIPLEESESESKLNKYVIPARNKKIIKIQLNALGINEGSVFPDLDGMCRQLTWKATNTNYTQKISGTAHIKLSGITMGGA